MKVAILGGTGFVGSYLVDELLKKEHMPRLLARPGSEHKVRAQSACESVIGDVEDADAVEALIETTNAVIYSIGILREFPSRGITFEKLQFEGVKRAADLAAELGVRRFILMSANGVEQSMTPYQRTKLAAEAHLQGLDLDWTIFRPSVIFGDPRGRSEFASMLKHDIIDSPMPAPLFFTGFSLAEAGAFELSPVHVENVAAAFAGALNKSQTFGQTYTLGGPQNLSWKAVLRTIADVTGKQKLMLPVPAFGPELAAAVFDRYPWFPISRDQIRMLLAGNVCTGDEIFNLLGIDATPFNIDTLAYLSAP